MGLLNPEYCTSLDNNIQLHIDKATELALNYIDLQARIVLLHNSMELKEFVMVGGIWFFVDKKGNTISNPDRKRYVYLEHLVDFIIKWDKTLNITGNSMRFTANGPKITNW